LAQLGGERLQCTEEQLVDALTGRAQPVHGEMLALQLQRLQLIDQQMARLNSMIAAAMKAHQDAVIRLAEVPGLGVDSAQQIIAEVGAQASTFPSAAELTSWVGTCPGQEESAEQNHSSRSAKGNKYLRRVLNQAAHAAVAKKGSYFQMLFRRLLPRLGYQSAVWAIAHRLCRLVWKILHEGVRYIEQGGEADPRTKKGSEQETVTPPAEMGFLILGDSGYTLQDERGGLEQGTGLAWVSGLPTRDRRAGQEAEAVGSAEARKPETDLLGVWAEASRCL
jgi:hypothetical protein